MSEQNDRRIGSIGWVDLTVENTDEVRDFYREVVGWQTTEVSMGSYDDYCMDEPQSGKSVAGICHARGLNAGIPAAWLIYINVADLDKSMAACVERGGEVIAEPRTMGQQGRYCVIRDPAGAVAALFEPAD
ncbi:MAG TPA: VOC family protein [Pyrinomonadaceae bacterium]|jgi:hypothetical protein